jgi:hypothetical protein
MNGIRTFLSVGCAALLVSCATQPGARQMERVTISRDGKSFALARSGKPFAPWGVNYGNRGRLMEDFWETAFDTIDGDFREIRMMGGNVVRVHLQFGMFMRGPNEPDSSAFALLQRLLASAERAGLHLDITGLACYRPGASPAWYNALDDNARWEAQASFWRAVARECAGSPAVFCYNLMNEPISPADKRTNWYSGNLFGGLDFVQYIAREPAGRTRAAIAIAWIQKLSAAIREQDRQALITVGMLPWVTGWQHLSGIVPMEIAPHVDFVSVHIYPKTKLPVEARRALRECTVGKPIVIEETFPLECTIPELESFLRESRTIAAGWVWHYDGITIEEYDAMPNLTIAQSIWKESLKSFVRIGPEFRPAADKTRHHE